MTALVNVHRCDTKNCGDFVSGPARYLRAAGEISFLDLRLVVAGNQQVEERLDKAGLIILGGGGLIDRAVFDSSVQHLLAQYGSKTVIWGAGRNSPGSRQDHIDLSGGALVGLRDYLPESDLRWVPCASCLHPALRRLIRERPKRKLGGLGFYENDNNNPHPLTVLGDFKEARRMGNKGATFEGVISFILSLDLLVTTSFHGAYWATLCGVPVIAVPSSSKFYTMKHQPPLAPARSWTKVLGQEKVFPEALEECEEANRAFMRDVNERFPLVGLMPLPAEGLGARLARRIREGSPRFVRRVLGK